MKNNFLFFLPCHAYLFKSIYIYVAKRPRANKSHADHFEHSILGQDAVDDSHCRRKSSQRQVHSTFAVIVSEIYNLCF